MRILTSFLVISIPVFNNFQITRYLTNNGGILMISRLLRHGQYAVMARGLVVLLLIAVAAGNALSFGCDCLTLSLCEKDLTCEQGSTGSVKATFWGGTAPYKIKIDNGSFVDATSPYTFSGLTPGIHTVTIKDANYCTRSSSVIIDEAACGQSACWLTGGGSKKSPIVDGGLGESEKPRKLFNWGGNVNPGCSPTAGDGGSWNLIDVAQSLHFHATDIAVVECGNVPGIPPGSTSPATPYNYIHYTGFGWLKGLKSNKTYMPLVYFWARAEDRNEPGSNGMTDGNGKDRLYVNVYTDPNDPNGSSIILLDLDGDPATIDPFTISTGNLQIHISSCDFVPGRTTAGVGFEEELSAGTKPTEFALKANYPNPFNPSTAITFDVAEASHVYLAVFNMLGQEVGTLVNGELNAGTTTVEWNAVDYNDMPLPSGMYIYRMQARSLSTGKEFQSIRKMMLMK